MYDVLTFQKSRGSKNSPREGKCPPPAPLNETLGHYIHVGTTHYILYWKNIENVVI